MNKYTVHDISKMLNVDPETVRRWIRTGNLNGTAMSKKGGYFVNEMELMKFVANKPKYRTLMLQRDLHVHETYDDLVKASLRQTLQDLISKRDRINKYIAQLETLLKEF